MNYGFWQGYKFSRFKVKFGTRLLAILLMLMLMKGTYYWLPWNTLGNTPVKTYDL
jgi:ABC-type glycerol-3-phosphate transport system permease component